MKYSVTGTFAADGNSSSVLVQERALVFVGGDGGLSFGSGTVTIQAKGPDNQWYSLAETITARDVRELELLLPCEVRIKLSGSTAPDLDYAIQSDIERNRE